MANSSTTSNARSNDNSSFWQNYALGYSSAIWDPRLVKYRAEGLFRRASLASGGTGQRDRQGRQGDLGYKFGASLLSASAIPFSFQASRTTSTSLGDLGPANPIRSGMIAPSGAPPGDFDSRNGALSVGWRLELGRLPRVELSYRRGDAVVTAGQYRAEQYDRDLLVAVSKDTTTVRQSFSYQRTSFENLLAQTFTQQLDNLDYNLSVALGPHTRLTGHAGHRATFVRSEVSTAVSDADAGVYVAPPSLGAAGSDYALAGIEYQPSGRFSLRLRGTADRQTGQQATTGAKLATMSSHVEVVRGLTLTASASAGVRGQMVREVPITVATRNAVAGVIYRASVRWLTGSVSATRGVGRNATPEGQPGATQSWSREASLSATLGRIGLGAGFQQERNRDSILDYGNYDGRRTHVSAQTQVRRVSVSTSADQLHVERGVGGTFARNVQRTFSGSAAARMWHGAQMTATAGGFANDYDSAIGTGHDQTLFYAVHGQVAIRPTLRLAAWIRREGATASQTGYEQHAFTWFWRLEYQLRMLKVAGEYRNNQSRLRYGEMPRPDDFEGRQFRVSVSRQFGLVTP